MIHNLSNRTTFNYLE